MSESLERLSRIEALCREILSRLPSDKGSGEIGAQKASKGLEEYLEKMKLEQERHIASVEAKRMAEGRPLDGVDGQDLEWEKASWML